MPQTPKHRLKKRPGISKPHLLIFALVFGLIGAAAIIGAFAAPTSGVQLYLNPSSQTMTTGASFSVAVRLEKANNFTFDTVKAYLNFPTDKLAVSSISTTGSSFDFSTEQTFDNSAGTIHISRSNSTAKAAGDYLVATITFTSKSSGTATVSFDGQSKVYGSFVRGQPNQLTGTNSGAYTINNPASPPPPPPPTPPSPTPTPTPAPTPTPSPTPSPSPSSGSSSNITGSTFGVPLGKCDTSTTASVDNAKTKQITYRTVLIEWEINPALPSVFTYGTDLSDPQGTLPQGCALGTHSVAISQLQPGTTYKFKVSVPGTTPEASYEGDFTTVGWPVVLSLSTAGGQPLSNASVTIDGKSYQTGGDGKLKLDLLPGKHTLKAKGSSFDFTVKSQLLSETADTPPAQNFAYKVTSGSAVQVMVVAGVAVLAAALLVAAGLRRRRQSDKKPAVLTHKLPKPELKSSLMHSAPIDTEPKKTEAEPAPEPPPELPRPAPTPEPPPVPEPPPMPMPQPKPQPSVPAHLAPPPHATEYPWVIGQELDLHHPGSSIAADPNYVEPEDMFSEGKKRLSQEGLGTPPKKQ